MFHMYVPVCSTDSFLTRVLCIRHMQEVLNKRHLITRCQVCASLFLQLSGVSFNACTGILTCFCASLQCFSVLIWITMLETHSAWELLKLLLLCSILRVIWKQLLLGASWCWHSCEMRLIDSLQYMTAVQWLTPAQLIVTSIWYQRRLRKWKRSWCVGSQMIAWSLSDINTAPIAAQCSAAICERHCDFILVSCGCDHLVMSFKWLSSGDMIAGIWNDFSTLHLCWLAAIYTGNFKSMPPDVSASAVYIQDTCI